MTQAKRRNIVFGVEEKFLLGIQDTVHHYGRVCARKSHAPSGFVIQSDSDTV